MKFTVAYMVLDSLHLAKLTLANIMTLANAENLSGESNTTCEVTSDCYNIWGTHTGEVKCTGKKCSRGDSTGYTATGSSTAWVKCDDTKISC
jgi:hypothetical protein